MKVDIQNLESTVELTQSDLALRAQQGCQKSAEKLFRSYEGMMRYKCDKWAAAYRWFLGPAGVEGEDIFQELSLEFFTKIITGFNSEAGAFEPYATASIAQRLSNVVRKFFPQGEHKFKPFQHVKNAFPGISVRSLSSSYSIADITTKTNQMLQAKGLKSRYTEGAIEKMFAALDMIPLYGDAPVSSEVGSATHFDFIPVVDTPTVPVADRCAALVEVIIQDADMTEKQENVFRRRLLPEFIEEQPSLKEVAAALDISSTQGVAQLQERALAKFKEAAENQNAAIEDIFIAA